jgi:hypothetical protein
LIIKVEFLHQNGVQTMGDLWNAQVQQWKSWFEVKHVLARGRGVLHLGRNHQKII